jgi:hypothetical protein
MDMWTTVLWVFVVALVWVAWVSGWVIWFEHGSRGREEDGNDDEDMRTLQRVLSWHAERIGRLEAELERLQEAGARRRLSGEGFSRSTGSL